MERQSMAIAEVYGKRGLFFSLIVAERDGQGAERRLGCKP